MKQILSYGPTNIRRQCTKFSRPGPLEGWIPVALVVEESWVLLSPKKIREVNIIHSALCACNHLYIHKYTHMSCVKLRYL